MVVVEGGDRKCPCPPCHAMPCFVFCLLTPSLTCCLLPFSFVFSSCSAAGQHPQACPIHVMLFCLHKQGSLSLFMPFHSAHHCFQKPCLALFLLFFFSFCLFVIYVASSTPVKTLEKGGGEMRIVFSPALPASRELDKEEELSVPVLSSPPVPPTRGKVRSSSSSCRQRGWEKRGEE